MIHVTAQMRVLVAIEPVDGRKRIDSLVRVCQSQLGEDPFSGCVFFFRYRSAKSILGTPHETEIYVRLQRVDVMFSIVSPDSYNESRPVQDRRIPYLDIADYERLMRTEFA